MVFRRVGPIFPVVLTMKEGCCSAFDAHRLGRMGGAGAGGVAAEGFWCFSSQCFRNGLGSFSRVRRLLEV